MFANSSNESPRESWISLLCALSESSIFSYRAHTSAVTFYH